MRLRVNNSSWFLAAMPLVACQAFIDYDDDAQATPGVPASGMDASVGGDGSIDSEAGTDVYAVVVADGASDIDCCSQVDSDTPFEVGVDGDSALVSPDRLDGHIGDDAEADVVEAGGEPTPPHEGVDCPEVAVSSALLAERHAAMDAKAAELLSFGSLKTRCHFSDGALSIHERGRIYYLDTAKRVTALDGNISDKYASMGGHASVIGYPLGDVWGTYYEDGQYTLFQRGVMLYKKGVGAFALYGAFREWFISLGLEGGKLGYPAGDERRYTLAGVETRRIDFEHGTVFWRAGGDAWPVLARDNPVQRPSPNPAASLNGYSDSATRCMQVTGAGYAAAHYVTVYQSTPTGLSEVGILKADAEGHVDGTLVDGGDGTCRPDQRWTVNGSVTLLATDRVGRYAAARVRSSFGVERNFGL